MSFTVVIGIGALYSKGRNHRLARAQSTSRYELLTGDRRRSKISIRAAMAPSHSKAYLDSLARQLIAGRFADFRHIRSKNMLSREREDGADVIVLSAAAKFSPSITVAFYVGRRFFKATEVEKRCGWESSYYQINQFSYNAASMRDLGYSGPNHWDVDAISGQPSIVDEVTAALEAIALPFLLRFTSLQAAQAATSSGDSWCLGTGGQAWWQLFAVDAALGDLGHFRAWARSLDPLYRSQASKALAAIGEPPLE
jgi:hypothetical protein